MARDPIIEPFNVTLTTTFPKTLSSIMPPKVSPIGEITSVQFRFGPKHKAVVSMNGSVQSGLFAASDRKDCDLEFMQFVTPTRFVRVYVNPLAGSTTFDHTSDIRNQQFLDTPTNDDGAKLVPVHGPFMSPTTHNAAVTRDGHFINSMGDSPGFGTPAFVVAQDSERHFLFQVSLLHNFVTLLVFIHPSGRRQIIALIRWTVTYDFNVKWREGQIATIFGKGEMAGGKVTTDPGAFVDFEEPVKNPPRAVINQILNPKLMQGLTVPLPDPDQTFFSPLRHPAADSGFWVP